MLLPLARGPALSQRGGLAIPGELRQRSGRAQRVGDTGHKGLVLLLNDGSSARTKGVTSLFKNATLSDKTGDYAGTITTDANGYGYFPVNGRSRLVWVSD